MFRNYKLKDEYIGMIPYSLNLIKLYSLKGFKTHKDKHDKIISNDIINVTFDTKVKDSKSIGKCVDNKIKNTDNQKYIDALNKYKEMVVSNSGEKHWGEINITDLRNWIYENGFTVKEINKRTGIVKDVHYVCYKRSPAKARTGQCLFIKESLYKDMIKWSRIGLPFRENMEIDYPSLLATESLTLSSIVDTIRIPVKNMLLLDDVDSTFQCAVDRVFKQDGKIVCEQDNDYEISNSLYDGESLLDSSFFNGHGFMQLRQHFFKSAAFNCNIQQFMRDYFKVHIAQFDRAYDDWTLKDMFGNEIFAKEVRFIFTPNSLKVLKFANIVDGKNEIYNCWKAFLQKENYTFGICKNEKPSKRGYIDGKILNQTAYQMINSLDASKEDIARLSAFEIGYTKRLKNDDTTFMDYLAYDSNEQNSNDMWIALYHQNPEIVNTDVYRDFKATKIHDYNKHCMRGKIRLQGDYMTMCGNGLAYLYHAVGVDYRAIKDELQGNDVYCTGFDFGKSLVGFRNPHTTPGSVLVVRNVHNSQYQRYFNPTDNIVYVNSIDFPLENALAGSDFDGDTVLLIDNPDLLQIANKMRESGKYRIYINDIDSSKKKYKLCAADMATIDAILGESQKTIGQDIDLGAFAQSLYWDTADDDYYTLIQITSALSNIAIDNAKKLYDITLMDEINKIRKQLPNIDKPLFFRFVGKSKYKNNRKLQHYNCPMDYLQEIFSKIRKANKKDESFYINEFLNDKYKNVYQEDRHQISVVMDMITSNINYVKSLKAKNMDKDTKNMLISDSLNVFKSRLAKKKINTATMYSLLRQICKLNQNIIPYFNALFLTHNDEFVSIFAK